MWQWRRCEILHKGLRVGHHGHRATCTLTQLQLQLQLPSLTNASYRSLHFASSIHLPVMVPAVTGALAGVAARSGGLTIRPFHSTNLGLQAAGKDNDKDSPSAPPTPTPTTTTTTTSAPPPTTTTTTTQLQSATAVGDDEVPVWQNPLHHNHPDMQKMFPEDFQEGETMVAAPMPPLETDPNKVVAPPHIHELAHKIVHLTLLELKELTDKIAQHFDFDDQVMAASYSGGLAGGAAVAAPTEEPPEKKVIFDLKLVGFDEKAKIKVIKEIRAIAGLGLKEAKELVESAPKVFQKDLKQERAEELKAQLEAVGAQVEIV